MTFREAHGKHLEEIGGPIEQSPGVGAPRAPEASGDERHRERCPGSGWREHPSPRPTVAPNRDSDY